MATPTSVIAHVLRHRQAEPSETEGFKGLRHNFDLCPGFQAKATRVMESFNKYRSLAYDIQGLRDRGSDVLLRFSQKEGDSIRYVALQIKAYDELEDNRDLESKLKLQAFDAKDDLGDQLDRYYVLLCGSATRHKDKVRTIARAFAKDPIVEVIEPTYAWSCYKLQNFIIDAIADHLLSEDDFVRKAAQQEIIGIGRDSLYVLLSCLTRALETSSRAYVDESFVTSRLSSYAETVSVFEPLETRFLLRDSASNGWHLALDSIPGLLACYFDARARYDYRGKQLVDYLFQLFERFATSAIDSDDGD